MAKKRIKYKPGDIFRIPCPNKRVAYGQVLLDLHRLWSKTTLFDDHEDCCLASPLCNSGLLVQIFDHKGCKPAIDKFQDLARWPPFFASHSQIYSGEFPIIGHLPVSANQLDFPEGTMSHGYPTEYHTFDKGGVSVKIEMTEEEYIAIGGIPGISIEISPSNIRKAIDGDQQAANSEFTFRDLRLSPRRNQILKRAGLSAKMNYFKMAQKTKGVLPQEIILATEEIYPGTTAD